MNSRWTLLFLLFCFMQCYVSLFNIHRLTGGGDFSTVNRIVENLVLDLDLSIEDKDIETTVLGFIPISAIARVGDKGTCIDLAVNPGGDILVTGEFLPSESVEGFIRPLEVYEITIVASEVQFTCTIPLQVEILTLGFLDTSDDDGTLTFSSPGAFITQKVRLYSPDFSRIPPVFAEPGICVADPVFLEYDGNEVGSFATFDITGIVEDEVRSDETLVFGEVQTELCKLGLQLAEEISSIAVNNVLVNQSSEFYIESPFVIDENGELPSVRSEKRLRESLSEERLDGLLDFNDRENFFVELIVPKDPEDISIITQILDFITDPEGESNIDPLILFLNQTFNVSIEEDGSIIDFDTISIFNGSFFDPDLEESDVDLTFNFNYTLDDIFLLNLTVELNSLFLSIFPPQPEVEGEQAPSILPAFKVLEGAQNSLFLDGIDINDVFITLALSMDVRLLNFGTNDPDLFYLATPFDETLREIVDITIDWKGFVASFGLLMAFDLDVFTEIEIGPLIEFIFDCGLSSFVITPRITGGTIDHEVVDVTVSQLFDALSVAAADIIQVMIPVYQIVLPRALELIIAETLTDQQLLNETECPVTDESFDDVNLFPFNFDEGIFKEISDTVDTETVKDLLEAANLEDIEIVLLGDPVVQADGLGFTIPMPEDANGSVQNISIFIEKVSFNGILPPHLNNILLLDVIDSSDFFPQELRTILDIGDSESPIGVNIFLALTGTEPSPFREEFNMTLSFDRVDILLDLFLHYSIYDVNATVLGDVLNIGCWTSKLNFPGKVTDLKFVLSNLQVTGDCTCGTPVAQGLFNALINPAGWPELLEFIDDALNRFGLLVRNLFSDERYEGTVNVAELICETDDFGLIGIPEIKTEKPAFDFGVVLPLMSFFAFAVITPGIVACLLARFSPKGPTKHKLNHKHNNELIAKVKEDDGSDQELLDHLHLTKPMCFNPMIPGWARIVIPIAILINTVLFIIGDTGDAVLINVIGDIFGVPYDNEGFTSLSVISSVIKLYQSGGIVLAILLFTLSIMWPYLKLLIMITCWFFPPSLLSVNRRGKIIEMLDFLGRFSFAEFHFLVFVLVVFQVTGGAPNTGFLPEEDLFTLGLEIVPLVSLFTFALAVVVSIVISNVMLVFQHNIEDETRIKLREKHLQELSAQRRDVSLVYNAEGRDIQQFQLSNWNFTVYEKDEDTGNILHQYTYSITKPAVLLYAGIVVFAFASLLAASLIGSVRVRFVGFFSYFMEFADLQSEYELSVFDLLLNVNKSYEKNIIIYFVSTVFILTVTLIPLVQTILLLCLLFKSVSVKGARRLTEAHHVITVWCCVDVFVLALTLTVLELPTIASGLISTLDFCDTLTGVVATVFVPMGYMTPEDAEAGCVAVKSEITQGGFAAVLSVFTLAIANLFVSRLFYFYISDRERIIEVSEVRNIDRRSMVSGSDEANVKKFHLTLKFLGLITIDTDGLKKNLKRDSPRYVGHRAGSVAPTSISKWIKEQRTVLERKSELASMAGSGLTRRPKRPSQSIVSFAKSNVPSMAPSIAPSKKAKRQSRPEDSLLSAAKSQVPARPARPTQSVVSSAKSSVLPSNEKVVIPNQRRQHRPKKKFDMEAIEF